MDVGTANNVWYVNCVGTEISGERPYVLQHRLFRENISFLDSHQNDEVRGYQIEVRCSHHIDGRSFDIEYDNADVRSKIIEVGVSDV